MSDDVSDPREELDRAVKSISTLSAMLKVTVETKQRRYLEKEIERLQLFREQLLSSFELSPDDDPEGAAQKPSSPVEAGPRFPTLESIGDRFKGYPELTKAKDPEMRKIAAYLLFFEIEYLPLYDKKKLDLDHLNGLELETFYDLFIQIKRRLEIFTTETEVIYEEKGLKQLKRLKAKQTLLTEIFKFFRKIDDFSLEIIADIEGDQVHCFNGNSKVRFGQFEQSLQLFGKSVRASLLTVHAFTEEIMSFIDLPSFKRSG